MADIIDARGLSCPEPVVLTKKALHRKDEIVVLVDNETALENVERLAVSMGCTINVNEEADSTYRIEIKRSTRLSSAEPPKSEICGNSSGPMVILFTSNIMGHGDDELGAILMKAYIHTLRELDNKPDIMVFYNKGVMLTTSDSGVADDLKELEGMGIKILICGTCVNYFNIQNKISIGTISNMYTIATTLLTAGRIVKP
ncbi:MAG: sulfurtransferase-like selenium metabolism protein YedF [Syntrophorhabdaceae bacterium]|nr:sulfurtransferase-like selenium metabolism protein YedF [Syntrophorhabdaceae bacterium]